MNGEVDPKRHQHHGEDERQHVQVADRHPGEQERCANRDGQRCAGQRRTGDVAERQHEQQGDEPEREYRAAREITFTGAELVVLQGRHACETRLEGGVLDFGQGVRHGLPRVLDGRREAVLLVREAPYGSQDRQHVPVGREEVPLGVVAAEAEVGYARIVRRT